MIYKKIRPLHLTKVLLFLRFNFWLDDYVLWKFTKVIQKSITAQKMKLSIKDFFSKCDQIRRKLRIWSHLLEKFLMENFIFWAVSCFLHKYLRKEVSSR